MPPNRMSMSCACLLPYDGVTEYDMTRQRHVYETAFDCRISKSEDELDQIDKVSNHPVLLQIHSNKSNSNAGSSIDCDTSDNRRKVIFYPDRPSSNQADNKSVSTLSQHLQRLQLTATEETSNVEGDMVLRGFTPSPPSTAPLPTKFRDKNIILNNTCSAPNLPSGSKGHRRHKDLRLPVKSLRGRMPVTSEGDISKAQSDEKDSGNQSDLIQEIKGRPGLPQGQNQSDDFAHQRKGVPQIKEWPRKNMILFKRQKDISKERTMEYKGSRKRHKYSSTESIMTSSSGGSMESLRSSTSEGNRSTTSSESRHSTSLSSHSSDSGSVGYYLPPSSSFLIHRGKLHILSPISDKSSQEPASEISDNNHNNNSQKCSPEEFSPPAITKAKKRFPQNKNLLNLGLHTADSKIQGSDSGISIQSHEGVKSKFGATDYSQNQDFSDLPFDMPKLRRRRMNEQNTSGSVTSVDLQDLPFDMPKLWRILRLPQSENECSVSQASSSRSVQEVDQTPVFKPKLTLNLRTGNSAQEKPTLGMNQKNLGLSLNVMNSSALDDFDSSLPLERQGWYHGSISRIEAEFVLRVLVEGSFLVRNSGSTRHDYSLSLKSARGFMHIRIRRSGPDDSYILGHFSKPFKTIPEMIRHFSLNRLPIRGAEHMCLVKPVNAQLL